MENVQQIWFTIERDDISVSFDIKQLQSEAIEQLTTLGIGNIFTPIFTNI